MAQERPVFFDPSGKRWRVTKAYVFMLVVLVLVVSGWLITLAVKPVKVPFPENAGQNTSFLAETRSPAELAYALPDEVPVIGEGVFLRVVGIHELNGKIVAADVYSGKITKTIKGREVQLVKDQAYAIERYGMTSGKNIVLTFDDGPDPIYTPQILDLLSAESAHSSFFPIGMNIVKYPEISKRIVREGHDFVNHTFGHPDLDLISGVQAEQEITQTQRIIRETTGQNPALFRIPYGGNDDASIRDDKRAIMEAQRLGYVVASYDIDSHDWEYASAADIMLPQLDGKDKVILLHDAGGNRTHTLGYLRELIPQAKTLGYEFTSLSRLFKEYQLTESVKPTVADKASYYAATATIVWPKNLIHGLFYLSMVFIFTTIVLGIFLAQLQMSLIRPARRRNGYYPLVSVIVPAYNEEKVLKRTVKSLLASHYRNIEIIIIDDGSKDDTWRIVQELTQKKRVQSVHQENTGKAGAVNHGIRLAKGEIIVSVDADTVFAPQTIGKLTRYFYYPEIGAVAGIIKVGNIKNWITRWQALEYVTSINIERASQAFLRSIMVVPGACSAWRKEAVQRAGGYSGETLAEDCDLTLAVQKAGYQVVQDMEAIAYTECPETIKELSKQRFRWLFGNLQSTWKHRNMVFRRKYGWLGMYTLPKSILGIFMQLTFTPLLIFVTAGNLIAGETAVLLFYFMVANVILVITSIVALIFAHEKFSYLTATPAFRLIYSPLRTTLIYASVIAALGGMEFGWNKVVRTGTVMDIK